MPDLRDLPKEEKVCPEMTKTFRTESGYETYYTIKYAPCLGRKCGKWAVCAGAEPIELDPQELQAAIRRLGEIAAKEVPDA